jgi:hypothetical protein
MTWTELDTPDPSGQAPDAWLATLGTDAAHVSHDAVLAALDAARDEPGMRSGHSTEDR